MILAINRYFTPETTYDEVFSPERRDHASVIHRACRDFFERRGIQVLPVSCVDPADPAVDYVLYFDTCWQRFFKDRFLHRIPFEKRVLLLWEPPNVNPTLYYLSYFRRQFSVVFSWSERMTARYGCIPYPIFPWADPQIYRHVTSFPRELSRRPLFLAAVSSNRWAYMPTSTYRLRRRLYRELEHICPGEFHLYGQGWNKPCVFYEKWFGHPRFTSYRGALEWAVEPKLELLKRYKFVLVVENTLNEPGYVDCKLIDCLCARCVPVYLGWTGAGKYVAPDCYVNLRDFSTLRTLVAYLHGMTESEYAAYQDAIDRFLNGAQGYHYSFENAFGIIYSHLYEKRSPVRADRSYCDASLNTTLCV
mgnify:CR=1 FL=1